VMWVTTGRMDYLVTLDPEVKAPDAMAPSFFYLYWAALLIQVAAVIQLANTLTTRKGYALTAALWLLALAVSFLTSRIATIFLLLSGGCVWTYMRSAIRLRSLALVGVLAVVHLTAAGLYREALSAESLGMPREELFERADHAMVVRYVVKNFEHLYNLSVILEDVPSALAYRYGSTFAQIFVKPVPRQIFVDKPLGASAVLTLHMMPQQSELGFVTGISAIGEFYLNFSIIGVVLGMWLVGCMAAIAYSWAVSGDPARILLHVSILTGLLTWFRADFNAGTTQALFYSLPILWVIAVGTTKKNSGSLVGEAVLPRLTQPH